ncbi:MAG: phosphatase PAP2 family protein [Candidatus Korobacteraceae bacterium]
MLSAGGDYGKALLQTLTLRVIGRLLVATALLAPSWPALQAQGPAEPATVAPSENSAAELPDTPSSSSAVNSRSFGSSLGIAAKTIGEDELHIIKSPFSVNALKWDALVLSATGVLIANDESVAYQVSPSWHNTSINISDAGVYGLGAVAGGIFVTGLVTHNEHATQTGIKSAEASVDSVILYAALKAILARQRPYTGPGEGKFFSGNWTAGSFPSGHAAFAWTLATVMAREYPNWPMRILMYGVATAVSTTRVTGGEHFPADVFAGSVLGFGVGTYVAHQDRSKALPLHSQNRIRRVQNALLEHVAIGAQ